MAVLGLLLLAAGPVWLALSWSGAAFGQPSGAGATGSAGSAPPPAGTSPTVVHGSAVATTPGSFWSIDAQTKASTGISTNGSVTSYLSASPFTWVRYGSQTDQCNETANLQYSDSGTTSKGCGFNVTSLKNWCASTTVACHSILSLPGENNNSAEDANIANYIVHTIGFQPDYWSIGNEPTGWTHYGIPWVDWKTSDSSKATPLDYAFDVKAAITAVTAVDPQAKFIGLEAACSCNTAWFQDVAKVDGSLISAIAYHSYPSTGSTTPSLSEFYGPLASSSNLTSSYASVRSSIHGLCTACATLPIFVNEYNAGPGAGPSNLAGSYSNAVFLAASVTQALRTNVTQLTMFNLQSGSAGHYGFALMDGAGVVGPTGLLFSQILSHLAIGTVFAGGVSSGIPGVWSVVTRNATSESLLVVNTNVTTSVTFSTTGSFLAGLVGASYRWSSTLSSPSAGWGSLSSSYTVLSQGILLITVPTSPGTVRGPTPVWPSGGLPTPRLSDSGLLVAPAIGFGLLVLPPIFRGDLGPSSPTVSRRDSTGSSRARRFRLP